MCICGPLLTKMSLCDAQLKYKNSIPRSSFLDFQFNVRKSNDCSKYFWAWYTTTFMTYASMHKQGSTAGTRNSLPESFLLAGKRAGWKCQLIPGNQSQGQMSVPFPIGEITRVVLQGFSCPR